MNVTDDGKIALLLLIKETSPAVLSSFSMWALLINKGRTTHGEYVIFIGMLPYLLECYNIYWNMLPYLLECYNIYWNMLPYLLEYIIFIDW